MNYPDSSLHNKDVPRSVLLCSTNLSQASLLECSQYAFTSAHADVLMFSTATNYGWLPVFNLCCHVDEYPLSDAQ